MPPLIQPGGDRPIAVLPPDVIARLLDPTVSGEKRAAATVDLNIALGGGEGAQDRRWAFPAGIGGLGTRGMLVVPL